MASQGPPHLAHARVLGKASRGLVQTGNAAPLRVGVSQERQPGIAVAGGRVEPDERQGEIANPTLGVDEADRDELGLARLPRAVSLQSARKQWGKGQP